MERRRLVAGILLLVLLSPRISVACGVSALAPMRSPITLAGYAPDDAPGVGITSLGHASFLIDTPAHITIVTDYNGYNIPREPPVIATMNHAHSTHFTMHPDPRIKHVLHGWMEGDTPPRFDLVVGDVRVRNVPTNIRDFGRSGTEYYGNSIFVFETAGLCIAHLSHLHHLLNDEDVAALGPLDVVMMPIDGTWTMNHEDVAKVMEQLHAPLYIPFHYYGDTGLLERFLRVVQGQYAVRRADGATVTLSRAALPARPEILVLLTPPG